jgi:ferredoxin
MSKVIVDADKCEGHARCVARAPELFDVDDDGMSFPLVDEVPADQEDAAGKAIDACPERAISFVE